MFRSRCSFAVLGILSLGGFVPHARAVDPPVTPAAPNAGGIIYETATNGTYVDFTVNLTNRFKVNIPGTTMTGTASNSGAGGLPRTISFPVAPGPRNGQDVYDARNEATIRSRALMTDMEGTSILDVESAFYNTSSGLWELEGIFGLVGGTLGDGVKLHIPDLFADTNKNSVYDSADLLYGLVDLRKFIVTSPTFGDTQTFQIVNGQVAALPGMQFSTTPFSFNPAAGSGDSPFSGTPYDGEAVVGSFHSIETPEPSAVVLILMGATWVLGLSARGKRILR